MKLPFFRMSSYCFHIVSYLWKYAAEECRRSNFRDSPLISDWSIVIRQKDIDISRVSRIRSECLETLKMFSVTALTPVRMNHGLSSGSVILYDSWKKTNIRPDSKKHEQNSAVSQNIDKRGNLVRIYWYTEIGTVKWPNALISAWKTACVKLSAAGESICHCQQYNILFSSNVI